MEGGEKVNVIYEVGRLVWQVLIIIATIETTIQFYERVRKHFS